MNGSLFGVWSALQEDEDGAADSAALPDTTDAPIEAPEQAVVCAHCTHVLTGARACTERGGAHAHTFVNPSGVMFDVRCYAPVPGARAYGEVSGFWSWFPGYAWQVALCGGCGAHVGWAFHGGDAFVGLIADAVVCGDVG